MVWGLRTVLTNQLRASTVACRSTWVTINTETRRPAKIPEDVKQRFRRLAPSPPRYAIAADQARKKLPEFMWPAQVCADKGLTPRHAAINLCTLETEKRGT